MSNTLPLEVVPVRIAAEFHRLPTAVRKLVRLCDGVRTLESLRASSALPAAQLERVVSRLVELGVVARAVEPKAAPRRLSPESLAWIFGTRAPAAPAMMDPPHAATQQTAPTGFTADEENFFSSSIDHLVESF